MPAQGDAPSSAQSSDGSRGSGSWLKRLGTSFGLPRAVALVFLFAAVVIRVWDPGPLELTRLKLFDFYQQLKPREADQRPVVIVDIDEASLKALGQWPWPRTQLAELIDAITRAGSVGIAMDIVFAEPDRTSPARVAATLGQLSDGARAELEASPDHDQVLAEAIARSRVVLGESALIDDMLARDLSDLPPTAFATLGENPEQFLFSFPRLLPNIPELERSAAGRGMFTIKSDVDGIVRRVPLVMRADDRVMPSLSLELLRVATGQRSFLIKTDDVGISSIVVAGVEIPTDRNARLWVHFTRHDRNRFVSAIDVMEGRVGAEALNGRLVLIGTSASGLYDLRATPLEGATPGVEAHAQVIENILGGHQLHQPHNALGAELLVTILIGVAIIILTPVLGPIMVLLLGAGVSAGGIAASWYLFDEHQILVDVVFPSLATLCVFALLSFANYYREAVQRRQVRSAFNQYLSPALVEELAAHPDRLTLGGETKELTILFSDVRGFTAISETYRHDPQGLTRLMNRFLTPLSNAIVDQRGTIDKYMGDAIMAFWNAPLGDEDHAAHACQACLDMLERTNQLNAERRADADRTGDIYLPLNVGVGINTGECMVGNMGSELRFDYSVLGDVVNVASRLEGQTKDYGARAIVGEATAVKVEGRFALVEIDLLKVVGKDEPVRIFALVGGPELLQSHGFKALTHAQAKMLECYRSGDFAAALARLEEVRGADADGFFADYCDIFEDRIRSFMEIPPPSGWGGIFVADRK